MISKDQFRTSLWHGWCLLERCSFVAPLGMWPMVVWQDRKICQVNILSLSYRVRWAGKATFFYKAQFYSNLRLTLHSTYRTMQCQCKWFGPKLQFCPKTQPFMQHFFLLFLLWSELCSDYGIEEILQKQTNKKRGVLARRAFATCFLYTITLWFASSSVHYLCFIFQTMITFSDFTSDPSERIFLSLNSCLGSYTL